MRYHEVDASKLQAPSTPTSEKTRMSLTQMFSPKGAKPATCVPPLHPGGSLRSGRPPMRPSPTKTPRQSLSRRGSSCDAPRSPTNKHVQDGAALSPNKPSSRRISLFHNKVDDEAPLTPSNQSSLRRLSLFGKREEEEDDADMDFNLLKSPQIEQNILRNDRKMFSPVKSIKRLSINVSNALNNSFSNIHNDDDEDDDSSSSDDNGSDSSDDSSGSDNCDEKKLSENDVALLLCREFSLMDDDDE